MSVITKTRVFLEGREMTDWAFVNTDEGWVDSFSPLSFMPIPAPRVLWDDGKVGGVGPQCWRYHGNIQVVEGTTVVSRYHAAGSA